MAEVTLIKNPAEQQLTAEWREAKARLPGPARLREAAFERFAATGLPHRRVEEWKYTDLRVLMREAKPLAPRPDADVFARLKDAGAALGDLDARRIVIADGYFVPELTDQQPRAGHGDRIVRVALPRGDRARERAWARTSTDDVAIALNTAFMTGGAVIHVRKDAATRGRSISSFASAASPLPPSALAGHGRAGARSC